MTKLKKIARIIIPISHLFVVCFITNTIINQHYHILSSGVIEKHAHPYERHNTDKPFQEHHHSTSEFIFLHQVFHTVVWMYSLLVFLAALFFISEVKRTPCVEVFRDPALIIKILPRSP